MTASTLLPLLLFLLAVTGSGWADPVVSSSSSKDPPSSTPAAVTTTPDYGTSPPFESGEPQGPSLGFILGVIVIIVTIFYVIGKQAHVL